MWEEEFIRTPGSRVHKAKGGKAAGDRICRLSDYVFDHTESRENPGSGMELKTLKGCLYSQKFSPQDCTHTGSISLIQHHQRVFECTSLWEGAGCTSLKPPQRIITKLSKPEQMPRAGLEE